MQSMHHTCAIAVLFLVSLTSLSLGTGAMPAVAQAQPGSTAEYSALKDAEHVRHRGPKEL